ncbi:MAG TPA: acyl-CoA desaturase [Nocardiopsis listeri]|uniref:fatty acid desaturase family protein n=1 Tax=Nocardiopsis listeri TaxID=53440 RepID=UPI001DCD1D3E|nr:acyl-CoA desaturase [Nocardiopsis listeri]HJE56892.1 acyl-CoA desaturase [Nocardiopsis listeri]
MERTPAYFAIRLTLIALAYVGGWTAFVLIGASWWQLVTAVALAVVFGQVGLVSHELAHRQIFNGRRLSEGVGRLVGNLGIGLGYGWWQDKHTRHHANPNHEEFDPDVQAELFVWSQDQADRARGLPAFFGRYQAFLFYPVLLLEALNLHYGSVRALLRPSTKHRVLEGVLLAAHFVLYLGLVFAVLEPLQAVVFIVIQQGLFGVYLGCIFAPNHKGMPTLKKGEKLDFLRKQVLTSRNVRGGAFTDLALGGLNYQIEHHLFPNMPSPHLAKAQPIVRDYCEEIGVPYHETGFFRSHAEALSHLYRVGATLRGSTPARS